MEFIGIAILKVGLALVVGFFGGKVAQKFKLPSVSGYLIAGLFLGPSIALFTPFEGFITSTEMSSLNFIKEIALTIIAFSIGSEFGFKNLKKIGNKVAIITLLEVLCAVLLVFTLILFIPKPAQIMQDAAGKYAYLPFSKGNLAFTLLLAAMSATTAPAATLLVIKQYRAHGPVTKTVLPIAALDDIFGIIAFGLIFAVAKVILPHSSTGGAVSSLAFGVAKPFIEVFGSIIIGIVVGVALAFLANKYDKERDDIQVLGLASVVICLGLSYYIKKISNGAVEISPLLANIAVGASVANLVKKPHRTYHAMNDFSSPLYILFFTLSGASLDLRMFGRTSPVLFAIIALYIVGRSVGKYTGASIGAKAAKADPMVQKYIGFALLPQGGVSLGLIVIVANSMREFGATIAAIILITTLFFETTGPLFSKFAISKAGEINGLDKFNEVAF